MVPAINLPVLKSIHIGRFLAEAAGTHILRTGLARQAKRIAGELN
jgi:hypothetical protein